MSLDVTAEVRKAVERLPDGAAVTLEAMFDTLVRLPGAYHIDQFTGNELRQFIQRGINKLRDESVITLERFASDRNPAVYRKGLSKSAQKSDEPLTENLPATPEVSQPSAVTPDKPEDKKEATKMPKFDFNVGAEVRRIVEGLKEGAEIDMPRVFDPLVAAHPVPSEKVPILRTYVAQTLLSLKGKLLNQKQKGGKGQPAIFCRISTNGKGKASTKQPRASTAGVAAAPPPQFWGLSAIASFRQLLMSYAGVGMKSTTRLPRWKSLLCEL